MNRVAAFVALSLLAPVAALSQPPRSLLPQEVITDIPDDVQDSADRASIAAFLKSRETLLQRIVDRSLANCPALLGGEMTTRQFAENVDREEDASRAGISRAWAKAASALTPESSAKVDLIVQTARGYTIEGNLTAAYDAEPYRLDRSIRWRCEVGFHEPGQPPPVPLFVTREEQ